MTANSAMNSARPAVPSGLGASRAGAHSGLLIAAGLFLVILIVEALIIVLAVPTSLDLGTLYVTVT